MLFFINEPNTPKKGVSCPFEDNGKDKLLKKGRLYYLEL